MTLARFIDRKASERTLVVSRLTVVVLGLFALFQGAYFKSILAAALYAYTIYGAAVTPSVMAVFFWRRATAQGAVASIFLGTIVTIAWQWSGSELDAIYPALGASVVSLILISLMTPAPTAEQLKPFFEN
jgi:SSS family solute:Na+ symporter/sodium/proline symporter